MAPSTLLLYIYIFVTPRVLVWIKSGIWSIDFLISVLLLILTPDPKDLLTRDNGVNGYLPLLGWLSGSGHALYVVKKSPVWIAKFQIFQPPFAPFSSLHSSRLCSSTSDAAFGSWMARSASCFVGWVASFISSWRLSISSITYFCLVGFIPCMLHACYVIRKHPSTELE